MKSLRQLIDDPTSPLATFGARREDGKYISREYQQYGYWLAEQLGDMKHKALYIKLAKEMDRGLLEKVRSFVLDSNADNKGALFMWKLKELKIKK